jgi:hypothetical protein
MLHLNILASKILFRNYFFINYKIFILKSNKIKIIENIDFKPLTGNIDNFDASKFDNGSFIYQNGFYLHPLNITSIVKNLTEFQIEEAKKLNYDMLIGDENSIAFSKKNFRL